MTRYVIRRCAQMVVALWGISVVVFLVLHLTGDPAALILPESASEEEIVAFRDMMGFNDPILVQYGRFMKGLVQLDFGLSYRQNQPAMKLVLQRMPATIELAVVAFTIALMIAVPAGILSATKPGTPWDHASMITALAGQSVPNFWLGLILIMFVAVQLDLLPTSGRISASMETEAKTSFLILEGLFTLNGRLFWDAVQHILLPALTVGLYATARLTRMIRSGMLEVLGEDYIKTARSKGLAEWLVINRHALKNASIPVVTLAGIELGLLLGGTVIVETVFSWPGVGFLSVESLQNDDFPIVQAAVFLLAFIFVFINLVVDVLYAWLDPRIQYE